MERERKAVLERERKGMAGEGSSCRPPAKTLDSIQLSSYVTLTNRA